MASKLSGIVASALIMGLIVWMGCGEDSPTGKSARSFEDGRIFLKNPTDYPFEVSYQNDQFEYVVVSGSG